MRAGDGVDSWRHSGGRSHVPHAAPDAQQEVVPLRGAGPPRVQGQQSLPVDLLLSIRSTWPVLGLFQSNTHNAARTCFPSGAVMARAAAQLGRTVLWHQFFPRCYWSFGSLSCDLCMRGPQSRKVERHKPLHIAHS